MSRTVGSFSVGSWLSKGNRWQLSNTCMHSSVVHLLRGSRLLRIVPENNATSWLTMVYIVRTVRMSLSKKHGFGLTTRVLRSSSPSVDMSMPSILNRVKNDKSHNSIGHPHRIFPPEGSIMRRSDIAKVDLPNNN
jgi:hypothetical protein